MSHAQPADERTYARYHNLVEGLCIASGLPKPRLVHHRRPRAERVRDRPQPAARGDRGHDRAAREDEPGRARRRARARAEPREELRRLGDDARGHDGRDPRPCSPTSSCGSCSGAAAGRASDERNNPVGAIFAIVRRRAAHLRADHRPSHAVRGQPPAGVPRRLLGRVAHALPAGPDLRAQEAARTTRPSSTPRRRRLRTSGSRNPSTRRARRSARA